MTLAALNGVLENARENATNTTDLGNRFERLSALALRSHEGPNGRERFEHVWLWNDWPGCDGPDTGIDLVAQQTPEYGGGLCAIQCKFYKGKVSTQDVDSFIAASSRAEFSHRTIMHTGTGIQHHGAQKMRRAHPVCEEFGLEELGRWKLDWWETAERAHAIEVGTQRRNVHKNIFGFFKAKLRKMWLGFWLGWFRKWRRSRALRKFVLSLEAILFLAFAAVMSAVVLGISLVILVFMMLVAIAKIARKK